MCSIGGVQFENNVWNAPVPTTITDLREIEASPAGAVVIKTCTLRPRQGNPDGYVLHEWGSTNKIALHNDGIDTGIENINQLTRKPVFISIHGSPSELVEMLRKLNQVERKDLLVEWNASCPNAEFVPASSIGTLSKTIPVLRAECKHPFGIKVPLYGPDFLTRAAVLFNDNNIDFITAINTIKGKGGRCIHKAAVSQVRQWTTLTNIPVIGVGGIQDQDDIDDFLRAGAVAVEIGTSYLRYGVSVFCNTDRYRLDLIRDLSTSGIIETGNFRLKSGRESNIYVDFRKAMSIPDVWERLVLAMYRKVKDLDFDLVCGVPDGAVPLAGIIALRTRRPLLMCRKRPKEHGTRKQLEGLFRPGQKCLVIEDVVTSGGSCLDVIDILERNGIVVEDSICLLNRGRIEFLSESRLHSIFDFQDMEHLVNYRVKNPIENRHTQLLKTVMARKKTRVCFSADIADPQKLLDMVDLVAPYICMVKIHLDALSYCPGWFADRLVKMAREKDFLLFCDRKFADIGKIVKRQAISYMRMIPFNFVTAHLISGEKTIDALMESLGGRTGILLVAQMSSQKFDPVYTRRVVEVASKTHMVSGIIAQEKLDGSLLHFVPGVNIEIDADRLGQNYRVPDDVSSFADILIVGSGIYNADDPLAAVKKYAEYVKVG